MCCRRASTRPCFEAKSEDTASSDLVGGDWVMRCEARTLDDIRALGGNDAADERRFATAARVSEINLALYRTFAQPVVRAMTSAPVADAMRQLHPLRLQYELFSDANPMMASGERRWPSALARIAAPVAADNPFLALQETMSKQIVAGLDAWREMTEAASERMFLSVYGSPALQAAVGIDPTDDAAAAEGGDERAASELLQSRVAELKSRISDRRVARVSRPRPALRRHGARPRRRARARGYPRPAGDQDDRPRPTLAEFKALVREQYYMLLIDQEATLAAIPDLLPRDHEVRRKGLRGASPRVERCWRHHGRSGAALGARRRIVCCSRPKRPV